jgi:hypothetical protein
MGPRKNPVQKPCQADSSLKYATNALINPNAHQIIIGITISKISPSIKAYIILQ